jgi:hypothetical protein
LCLAGLAATPAQALDPREAEQFRSTSGSAGPPQSTVTAIAQTDGRYLA